MPGGRGRGRGGEVVAPHQLDRDVLDATAFEDAISAGRVDEALALWRGGPFADLDAEAAAVEAARLRELWADAVERQAQQQAAAGQPQEPVAVLEELIAAEPLRESAVAVLMEVLAAAGRQADALQAFSRPRRALAEELGIEPSAALRATEERVLLPDIPPAGSPGGPVPLPVSSFVGRDTDVGAVRDLVDAHRIVTLCGPRGAWARPGWRSRSPTRRHWATPTGWCWSTSARRPRPRTSTPGCPPPCGWRPPPGGRCATTSWTCCGPAGRSCSSTTASTSSSRSPPWSNR